VPQDTTTEGTETVPGQPQTPVSGATGRLDQAQDQDVTTDPTTIQGPSVDLDNLLGQPPAQRNAQRQGGIQQGDVLQNSLSAQATDAAAIQQQTTQPAGLGFGPSYGFAEETPFEYDYPTETTTRRRRRIDLPEFPDRDGEDDEPPFGTAEQSIFTEFADPLGGGDSMDNGLFGDFEPSGNDPFGDPNEDNGPTPW